MLRPTLLAVALLVLAPAVTAAQVITGSTFLFDHLDADALDTAKYQLCVDAVSDTACQDIGVTRASQQTTTAGVLNTYKFTLPAWVPRGNRTFSVRAIGLMDTGASGPSNTITRRVIGRPQPPVNVRDEVKP